MDKNGAPVAIWYDGDELQCLVDGKDSHPPLAWRFCAKHPVSEEVYLERMETGRWVVDPPPVKPDKIDQPPIKNRGSKIIGINDPLPDLDAFDALRFELESEIETAEELLKQPVTDQEQADRIGVWAKKLSEIEARAEQRRVLDKEPFLVGGREVDAKWKPVTLQASTFASRLKQHLQAFLLQQKAAERARAESERVKAAEAWTKVGTVEDEEERAKVVAQAQAAEEAAIAKNATAGRTGMKVGLRSEKRARIFDYYKTLEAVRDHAEIKEVVEKLAQRSVKGGHPLPGVEIVTVEKVV